MSECPSATKPCRIRLVRLDECGVPVVGLKSVVVTKGFINVGAAREYQEGEEFYQANGCGEPCINEKDCDFLKRVNLTLGFCTIDHEGIEIMTSKRLLLGAASAAIGLASTSTAQCDAGWSLEVWQKQANAACTGGAEEWLYWAWPWITNGKLGDTNLELGPFTYEITGFTKPIAADDQWGADNRGPFAVLPATGPLIIGDHEALAVRTTVQPPAYECGAQELEDAA